MVLPKLGKQLGRSEDLYALIPRTRGEPFFVRDEGASLMERGMGDQSVS
jgi:hypothetical protein